MIFAKIDTLWLWSSKCPTVFWKSLIFRAKVKIRFEKLSNFWQSDKIFTTSEITRIVLKDLLFRHIVRAYVPTLFSYRLIKKWFALQDHPVFTVITGAFKIGFENIKNDQKEENKISQTVPLLSYISPRLLVRDYCSVNLTLALTRWSPRWSKMGQ